MKVKICDICDKIIGHKQGVTLKASDHTLTRIIDNHVISNMKRKYKVHICDDCIEAIEEYCKAAKAESNTKEVQTKIKGYTKLKMKTCDECRFLKVLNDDKTGVYAKCPTKTFLLWKEDTRHTTCDCWEDKNADKKI